MFAEDLAEFAEALLGWCDGYRDAGWPEDTPDYATSHYPGHLHAAGRLDDLVALLQDRAWYRRHEASDPSGVAYLAGVQTAWQAAEQLDAVELRAGRSPKVLGAEMRACLTAASLAGLSGAITPELIGALVATGAWAPRRAFQVAQMAPTAQERARLLVALAGEVGDDIREEVVSAAMAATNGIVEDWGRAHAWIDLAPHIPEALLDDALRFAENLPSRWGQFGERLRAWAVSSLLARAATLCLEDRVLTRSERWVTPARPRLDAERSCRGSPGEADRRGSPRYPGPWRRNRPRPVRPEPAHPPGPRARLAASCDPAKPSGHTGADSGFVRGRLECSAICECSTAEDRAY